VKQRRPLVRRDADVHRRRRRIDIPREVDRIPDNIQFGKGQGRRRNGDQLREQIVCRGGERE
jgi:hypothetical protein